MRPRVRILLGVAGLLLVAMASGTIGFGIALQNEVCEAQKPTCEDNLPVFVAAYVTGVISLLVAGICGFLALRFWGNSDDKPHA
jgi:hypothetical protein